VPYLEISLHCRETDQPRYERALEDVGALAVTLLDADAQTPNERAILEPGVGEMPIWGEVALSALFPHDADPLLLLSALEAFDADLDWSQAEFRKVEDQDWERAWMDQYEPLRFGSRTWIVPWNRELPTEATTPEAAVIRLDPGLAFGSGTHPTTALCLEWLDALASSGDLRDATVLDFGCGSGILALAALKLGAVQAVGVDNDPQAILASTENAQRNEVDVRLRVHSPADEPIRTYPVVIANILASALDSLADVLAARVAPGGRIALSGILVGQEAELIDRYARWFGDLRVVRMEDWVRIDGVRKRDNGEY
jgi:ribosomal protein L11 methyltransferase